MRQIRFPNSMDTKFRWYVVGPIALALVIYGCTFFYDLTNWDDEVLATLSHTIVKARANGRTLPSCIMREVTLTLFATRNDQALDDLNNASAMNTDHANAINLKDTLLAKMNLKLPWN